MLDEMIPRFYYSEEKLGGTVFSSSLIRRHLSVEILKKFFLFCFLGFFAVQFSAQEKSRRNFYIEIGNHDLSNVINAEKFIADNEQEIVRPKPIGFIGNNYQRFYIHYSEIKKNPANRYEYLVKGKTRVKNTIRNFKGTITVRTAEIYRAEEFPEFEHGTATCEVEFFENRNETSTGVIKGDLKVGFLLRDQKLEYDGLYFYSDGFANNTFEGTWKSYRTNVVKTCNWGDYRIPESGDLDIGAGEFSPNSKYFDKGWKYYILTLFGETENDVELGIKEEARKWWE